MDEDKLQAGKLFSIMDLESGFFYVPIAKECKQYTAFVDREGLFEFNRAPFGYKNSLAALIRFVQHIFQDLINVDIMQSYMENIIIYADTLEECLKKTKRALQKAAQCSLRIKWKK